VLLELSRTWNELSAFFVIVANPVGAVEVEVKAPLMEMVLVQNSG
jgi:hypothetical protein